MATLLEKKKYVDSYLKKDNRKLSSFSFTNIFAWKDYFRFRMHLIDKALCIFAEDEMGTFMYMPPLGDEVTRETVDKCFNYMERKNVGSNVSRIEGVDQAQLHLFPEEKFSVFMKGHEYCYYKDDVASLSGNKYKSKRALYNNFVKNNNYQYLPYNNEMFSDCIDLYDKWSRLKESTSDNDIFKQMLEENSSVHKLILKNFESLNLVGRVVVIDGDIKAYTFGYELNEDIFCDLIEIADFKVKGLSVFIFSELAKDKALSKNSFINVMDDFEMENVRATKMSFKPTLLLPSFVVKKKESAVF